MDIQDADETIEEPATEEVVEAENVTETEAEVEDAVVTFGDEEPSEEHDDIPAPDWVKGLRKKNREQAREIAALKKATVKAEDKATPLSAKPTLEKADYNEDKYTEQLETWYGEKAAHDKAQAAKKTEVEEQNNAWQSRLGEYNDAKTAFKPDTIEDAEELAREALSETQQGVLIEALGKNAAALLVGLAGNEPKLKALAGIKNPIRFAAEVARLESSMKTTTRRPKTAPEGRIVGSGSAKMGGKTLEQLEAEAERTGNRTKVQAYKRKQAAGG